LKLAAFVSLQSILAFLLVGLALYLRSGSAASGFKVENSKFKVGKARRHP
jgi:hypothetical protein